MFKELFQVKYEEGNQVYYEGDWKVNPLHLESFMVCLPHLVMEEVVQHPNGKFHIYFHGQQIR